MIFLLKSVTKTGKIWDKIYNFEVNNEVINIFKTNMRRFNLYGFG